MALSKETIKEVEALVKSLIMSETRVGAVAELTAQLSSVTKEKEPTTFYKELDYAFKYVDSLEAELKELHVKLEPVLSNHLTGSISELLPIISEKDCDATKVLNNLTARLSCACAHLRHISDRIQIK